MEIKKHKNIETAQKALKKLGIDNAEPRFKDRLYRQTQRGHRVSIKLLGYRVDFYQAEKLVYATLLNDYATPPHRGSLKELVENMLKEAQTK